jgi:nicotinate-nucleotide pyrophosphorylase (carboxylating)
MISEKKFNKEVDLIIVNAIREDIGDGDHSSLACIPYDARGKAKLLVKEDGIISGIEFAKRVFDYVDPGLKLELLVEDGAEVKYGDICFYVTGNSQSILKSERLILNAMQRMSAISTKTKKFVDLVAGTKTKILDTRKTTPGIRVLEKWAVTIGGGENHRFALYDMIMLKDNHIDFCGGITKAIQQTKEYLLDNRLNLKIIVEARNLIDNFNYEDTKTAVTLIGDKCLTESSGGITLDTVKKYAECGVDFISSGAITHSVYNMDLSLKVI